jgi:hypothetical protein
VNPQPDLAFTAAEPGALYPGVHYDHDYERIASVSELQHHWLAPDGSLA